MTFATMSGQDRAHLGLEELLLGQMGLGFSARGSPPASASEVVAQRAKHRPNAHLLAIRSLPPRIGNHLPGQANILGKRREFNETQALKGGHTLKRRKAKRAMPPMTLPSAGKTSTDIKHRPRGAECQGLTPHGDRSAVATERTHQRRLGISVGVIRTGHRPQRPHRPLEISS